MKNLSLVLLIGLLFSGCRNEDTFPDIPTLEYKKLTFGNDVGIKTFTLTATFTDGDGDVGYYLDRPNEAIFDDSLSDYYYNYVIELQVQKNGVWNDTSISYELIDYNVDSIDADNDTSIVFYNDIASARLPYLTQDGQNKGLKGDIEKTAYLPLLLGDSIRFHAYIYDRALHKSNEIFTPGFFVRNP
jgi:hypothetical protein